MLLLDGEYSSGTTFHLAYRKDQVPTAGSFGKAFAKYVGDNFQVYLDNIDFADGKSLVHWKDGHASYKK